LFLFLSASFSNYKWDNPLPWETKKPLTIMSFQESMQSSSHHHNNNNQQSATAGGGGARLLGPKTLRKEAASLSALYLSELASGNKKSLLNPHAATDIRVSINQNKVVSLDFSLLEEAKSNAELQKHIKAAEMVEQQRGGGGGASYFGSNKSASSSFLPARPDDEDGHTERSSITKRSSSSDNNIVVSSVQRPDLIGLKHESACGLERSKSTSGVLSATNLLSSSMAPAPQAGGVGNGQPKRKSEVNNNNNNPSGNRKSVNESSATATLNATMSGSSTKASPNGSSPHSSPVGGMLSKMSSFFVRK
jgi:hypothetical protein